MSESKQLNLFNKLENTSSSECQLQENTKSAIIGQTHTSNPNSIRVREKVRERKRLLVAYKGGECERCFNTFHENVFDFHHFDHTQKLFGVSQNNMQRSMSALLAEADKCFLLCANCHREVHTTNDPNFIKTNH
jgi:adenylate cyclase class IV